MSNLSDTPKVLEVKVRPFSSPNNQERPDQKGASRVHLCREALLDLKLESGQPCYLSKVGEDSDHRRTAIAWLTSEKSLSKKIIQISKSFQEACGLKLGDDLRICAAGESVNAAESIVLKDVTHLEIDTVPELSSAESSHWEWYLRENIGRAEVVFPGMMFKNISLRGPKRTFTVETVNNESNGLGQYAESSAVRIATRAEADAEHLVNTLPSRLEVTGVAGMDQAVQKLNSFLENFDRDFKFTRAQRSSVVLLHGNHGTGKSFLLGKIAETKSGKVHRIKWDVKPAALQKVFRDARLSQPSIILIDDIDSLLPKDSSNTSSITTVLGEELDALIQGHPSTSLPRVLVAATTTDLSSIPISLRKRGRFKTDIALPIPDATARKAILKSLAPPLPPATFDEAVNRLGDRTHAYTPEDLLSLLDAAYDFGERRLDGLEDTTGEGPFLAEEDFEKALLEVRPTAMHDITLKPRSVRWEEIGGQDNVKKALRRAVEIPLLQPERMKRVGVPATKGLLLYGPPGCSKTLSAQAMATELDINFFAVKGAELLNMYVGESERAVREIFARARAASPSIIFFDEIESIGGKREHGQRNGVNVLTTLLIEMDGIETLEGVVVLAATNFPQALDPALLRPGRFDKLLYVVLPDLKGREEILRIKKQRMDCTEDVDVGELARLMEGYSGAEMVAVCNTACDEVLERCEVTGLEEQVRMKDLVNAVPMVKKQTTSELIRGYEKWAAGNNRKN